MHLFQKSIKAKQKFIQIKFSWKLVVAFSEQIGRPGSVKNSMNNRKEPVPSQSFSLDTTDLDPRPNMLARPDKKLSFPSPLIFSRVFTLENALAWFFIYDIFYSIYMFTVLIFYLTTIRVSLDDFA